MMRRKIVLGNWKMNGDKELVTTLLPLMSGLSPEVDYAIFPPFVYASLAVSALQGVAIGVGGQDVSPKAKGAYTGEVSAAMLQDVGCSYALVGHSERRHHYGESSQLVALKAKQALRHNLVPVICLGETLAEREQGLTEQVLADQLQPVLATLTPQELTLAIIAYEPVWAIGTGMSAAPIQVQAVHAFLRDKLAELSHAVASQARIVYGGSLKPGNARELFALEDVDGGLVGGASLQADTFIPICEAAYLSDRD